MIEFSTRRHADEWRTILFVPADRPEMLVKAQRRGADAILIDLEDAIPTRAKAHARRVAREQLADGALTGPSALCVRINAVGEGGVTDLRALAGLHIDAVVVPKAVDASALLRVRDELDDVLADGEDVALIPQVESARGIVQLAELTSATRIAAIALGGEDLCVDLGVSRSEKSLELLVPRALVSLHAHALGLAAIDTVYTAIDDEPGLVREATVARQLGFSGKLLIHPAQIEPVRRVFAPSKADVDWARRVLADDDAVEGVRVVDGRMVDAPVIAQAERILGRAQ
jgi:citrate lyase subunit beta/citryl-CoA lyase